MPRPQLPPGTIGTISTRQRGRNFQARATGRSLGGKRIALTGNGPTATEAEEDLRRNFRAHTVHSGSLLNENSTIAAAVHAWLGTKRMAVTTGKLRPQSLGRYERIAEDVIEKIGAYPLREARASIMHAYLEGLVANPPDRRPQPRKKPKADEPPPEPRNGVAYAKTVRFVLTGAFNVALAREVIDRHPFAGLDPLPGSAQIQSWLKPAEFIAMRQSVIEWGANPRRRADWQKLLGLVDVAMGTSMRIGEILALRPMDLRLNGPNGPGVEVTGTVVEVEGRLVRQAVPKHEGQARVLPLPRPAAETLRALAATMTPQQLLFGTRTGEPEGNESRLIRRWRDSPEGKAWLAEVGVPAREVTFKLLRRSAGAHVRARLGLAATQALLGHRFEQTTESFYTPLPEIDPKTARELEAMWG